MATRKSRNSNRSSSSRTTHDIDPSRLQQAAHQGSQRQLTLAADATSTLLRGAEIWTQLQLHAIQRSSQSWREAAERLRVATNAMEIIGVQNQLMMNTFVQSLQLMQEMMQAGATLQPAAEKLEEAAAPVTEPLAAMMQGPMQAWQTMMNPMANGATPSGASH